MYRFHKEHHMTPYNELKYSDVSRGHSLESAVEPLGIIVPLAFYNGSLFVPAAMIVGIRAMMRHDDRFSWLIGNHHILHHKYPVYNFGEYWLDRLCGTDCPRKDEYVHGLLYT